MKVKDSNLSKTQRLLPLALSVCLLIIDQIIKSIVIAKMPLNTIYKRIFGDFIWLVHVRNTGAAFSFGADSSNFGRIIMFLVLPIVFMALIAYFICTKKAYLTKTQRWFAAGVLGGGLGTIYDRLFRFSEGVVDFVSVNVYGLFGMERWPTFNFSDSCVVVFVILMAISILFEKKDKNE